MPQHLVFSLCLCSLTVAGCQKQERAPVKVPPAAIATAVVASTPAQGGGLAGLPPESFGKVEAAAPVAPTTNNGVQLTEKAPEVPQVEPTQPPVETPTTTEAEPMSANPTTSAGPPPETDDQDLIHLDKPEPPVPAVIEPPAARLTGACVVVNGVPIPASKYYEEVDKITRRSAKIPTERMNRIKENILKRLIEKELISQAVQQGGILVPLTEIDAEFAKYKTRFRTDEQFQNYLRHGKVTIASIKQRIEEKLALAGLLRAQGSLDVTEAEIDEFYEKNERFYMQREGVKARHILIKAKEDVPEKDAALVAKLRAVQTALDSGEDFAAIAIRLSEGPSAPKGGDLGFFGRGQMVKPFEKAAFAMKVGEITGPVRSRFGFHYIEVLDKREARKKPRSEVAETIRESLTNKKFFQARRALINNLKGSATIQRLIHVPPPTPATP